MDFRKRLETSRVQLVHGNSAEEPLDHSASAYFATDRGNTPTCLDLRLPDGSRKAIPYSYFTQINFDVDAGIEVLTTQQRIILTGRNLISLYEALITYRVRYVQSDVGSDMQEDGLFIADISLSSL
ncbi:hypothetical protein [Mucilaginibacter sp. HD30]